MFIFNPFLSPNLGLVDELNPVSFTISYTDLFSGVPQPIIVTQQTSCTSIIITNGPTSSTITGYFSDVFDTEIHYNVPNEPAKMVTSFEKIPPADVQYTYWYDQKTPFIKQFYFTAVEPISLDQKEYYIEVRRNHTIARDIIQKNMSPVAYETANTIIPWINSSSQTVTWKTSGNNTIPWRRGF